MQTEAMARWKYQAQNADELSFMQGEVLEVHGPAPDADWYTVNQPQYCERMWRMQTAPHLMQLDILE
jgi:hypothetical protein